MPIRTYQNPVMTLSSEHDIQDDLEFDEDCTEAAVIKENDALSQESKTPFNSLGLAEYQDFDKMNGSVKVLREKYETENKNIDTKKEINPSESTDDLASEIQDILLYKKMKVSLTRAMIKIVAICPRGFSSFKMKYGAD